MKPFTVIFRKIDDIPKFFSKYPFYKLYEESDNYIDDDYCSDLDSNDSSDYSWEDDIMDNEFQNTKNSSKVHF